MKDKLRKIVINEVEYVYLITGKYLGNDRSKLTVRIYLSGYKQTPLIIEFVTPDDSYCGPLLNTGICLKNKQTGTIDKVNLNEPKYIRQLILSGLIKGWTGENKMPKQDGIQYLKELGYEVEPLIPEIN